MISENKKTNFISFFLFLTFLSFFLMFADRMSWLNWFKWTTGLITNPIQKKTYSFKNRLLDWWDLYSPDEKNNLVVLEKKAEWLELERAKLFQENQQLSQENQAMKRLLQVPTPPEWHFISSQVLFSDDQVMLIDQGLKANIKEGMMVVVAVEAEKKGAILLGKIEQVNPLSALVQLNSSPKSEIAAKVLIGGEGMVRGKINGQLVLENVLQEVNLKEGDLVVSRGDKDQYLPNLIIGKIKLVEKIESEVYQKAVLEPLVDWHKLERVFIVVY